MNTGWGGNGLGSDMQWRTWLCCWTKPDCFWMMNEYVCPTVNSFNSSIRSRFHLLSFPWASSLLVSVMILVFCLPDSVYWDFQILTFFLFYTRIDWAYLFKSNTGFHKLFPVSFKFTSIMFLNEDIHGLSQVVPSSPDTRKIAFLIATSRAVARTQIQLTFIQFAAAALF